MSRYFFEIAYDGGEYFGWQIQPNQVSVQQTIEEALTRLNSNNSISIVGCGRTDTGVHAESYVFHADISLSSSSEELRYKLNKMLPSSIAIKKIWEVENTLHARFSARKRTYKYFIHTTKNPFKHHFSTYYTLELDIAKMNEAAVLLLGNHDFTTFSKTNTDVKHHFCEVFEAKWTETTDGYCFEYTANRFLRNMVRATVGTLLGVGTGKMTIDEFHAIFKSLDRSQCGSSAPPQGLYLWKIEY